MTKLVLAATLLTLAACGKADRDPRGIDRDETLLSVSASGQADTRPDQAQFQAGINSWDKSAAAASAANASKIEEIIAALRRQGVAERDIQTRALSVQRVDWGDRKGLYQASNIVNVTVRKIAEAGNAMAAVTSAGANVLSGPDFRLADPEKAANGAYTAAYGAARARAQAYADAADMKIARVLTIRDAGGSQGGRYLPGAVPVSPPAIGAVLEQSSDASAARLMPGQTTSSVSVQVDFALTAK